uniref:NADH-ubiquinone oxidoreductase chain 1 n=1 Tax=Gnathostomula armata TaxID=231613 RepID=A0A0F6Q0U4_9BILA|nr:NADH dehydrogenase subunit 1 [Gnathostomula armata]AKD00025.1 NADH dehydrogenase subunit 1 [Gnathostomula armata]
MFSTLFLNNILIIILILLSVAFYTLLERKILSYSQIRKGPNKNTLVGLMQPLLDGLKLFMKNFYWLVNSSYNLMFIFSLMIFMINLSVWMFYSMIWSYSFCYCALIFLMFLFSLDVYKLFFSSYSSSSKYAIMSNFRMVSQFISYEVVFMFMFFIWFMVNSGFSFSNFNFLCYNSGIFLMLFLFWIIFILMEANRTPFDLSEGESELVSGFNVEYSSGMFTFLFLGEYSKILFLSVMSSFLFFKNFLIKFMIFIFIFLFFLFSRASFPRMRYDKIMQFVWLMNLPLVNLFLFISLFWMIMW